MSIHTGFVLTEAAEYAFSCQEVYPDKVSFAAAIPDHLKPIFLIPVRVSASLHTKESRITSIASKIAFMDGSTPEGDLFSYQTFLYNDITPNTVSTEPGSIFRRDDAQSQTHHQEYNFDQNIQSPTDTSFNSDVDISQYHTYPYRTEEKPIRKSSINDGRVLIVRLALTYNQIMDDALRGENSYESEKKKRKELGIRVRKSPSFMSRVSSLNARLNSFDKSNNTFTFRVSGGRKPHQVEASLVDFVDAYNQEMSSKGRVTPELLKKVNIAVRCDCPFWQYGGPEYHAKTKAYALSPLRGTADAGSGDYIQFHHLCKHTYKVMDQLAEYYKDIIAKYGDDLSVVEAVVENNLPSLDTPQDDQGMLLEEDVDLEDIEEEEIPLEVDVGDLPPILADPISLGFAGEESLPASLVDPISSVIFKNIKSPPKRRVSLTKKEVFEDFQKKIRPFLPLNREKKRSKLATDWFSYIQALYTSGAINKSQFTTWKNPYRKEISLARIVLKEKPANRTTLSKKEAFEQFKAQLRPYVLRRKNSMELLKQEWVNYLDILYESGAISTRQRRNWRNPYDRRE